MKVVDIPLGGEHKAKVLLGRDTRPSGGSLLEAAKEVYFIPLSLLDISFCTSICSEACSNSMIICKVHIM